MSRSFNWIPIGTAEAYGQQWRPAPGFAAATVRLYRAIANVPSFRPRAAARMSYAERFGGLAQRRHSALAASRLPHQDPYRRYARPVGRYQTPYLSTPPIAAGWPQPFGHLAGAWQPLPAYLPTFAGPPVDPRWAATPWPSQYDPYRAPHTAEAGAMPRGPRLGYARWRPVAPAALGGSRHRSADQASLSGPGVRPVFRGHTAGWPAVAKRQAASTPYRQAMWRPVASAPSLAWQPAAEFRPVAYGRSRNDQRIASRGAVSLNGPQQKLPGWVTTYQDSDLVDACSCCNGS